jgi:hypothetical protein
MYLHAGNQKIIRKKNLIGIFDVDNATVSTVTRRFLADAEKSGRVEAASDELPKSFLLYRTRDSWEICFSQLSSSALAGRVEHGIVKWERGERPVHEDSE